MAQIQACISWINQKIANLLGDFNEERRPEEDPSPTRALCRLCFAALIMGGLLSLLVYFFMESPDVWVEQINLSKEKDFARCSLYEKGYCKGIFSSRSFSYTTPRRPVVCPCNNINVKWRDFLRFFVVYIENTTEYNVTFGNDTADTPMIYVPSYNVSLLRNYVVKNESIHSADDLCNLVSYWPALDNESEVRTRKYRSYICHYMASTILPLGNESMSSFHISNEFLESPYLLNREVFNIQVAQRARESVLTGRMDLDIINFGNKTSYYKIYSLYADMLTRVLDRFESEKWDSYYQGALDLKHNLNLTIEFGDPNPWMIYLFDGMRLQFLHPEIDWKAYHNACDPLYCEETKKMSHARQAYRAFGLLGGVATLVLGLVTVLVWPSFALVLSWYYNRPNSAFAANPEDPEASLFPSTNGSSTSALTSTQRHDLELVQLEQL